MGDTFSFNFLFFLVLPFAHRIGLQAFQRGIHFVANSQVFYLEEIIFGHH